MFGGEVIYGLLKFKVVPLNVLPTNVLTEWKICHLICTVPFKEYIET